MAHHDKKHNVSMKQAEKDCYTVLVDGVELEGEEMPFAYGYAQTLAKAAELAEEAKEAYARTVGWEPRIMIVFPIEYVE